MSTHHLSNDTEKKSRADLPKRKQPWWVAPPILSAIDNFIRQILAFFLGMGLISLFILLSGAVVFLVVKSPTEQSYSLLFTLITLVASLITSLIGYAIGKQQSRRKD